MLSFEKKRKEHSYLTVINMKTFDCQLIALQKKIEEIYFVVTSKRSISQ